jgi:NitT/TauT family transport system substrate-binding protein
MQIIQSRRDFLIGLSAAGAASSLGSRTALAGQGTPETTTVRIVQQIGTCTAPQYVAEELLRAEGFTNVHYVQMPVAPAKMVGLGDVDFGMSMAPSIIFHQDAGLPIIALAGVHPGCWELFAQAPISTIGDLNGKTVDVPDGLGSSAHLYMAIMAKHVGLDLGKDIKLVTNPIPDAMVLFADGKTDAILASPPESDDLHARNVGKVILNSTMDQPWSHYYCCMLAGNADYVRNYPEATKRVLRAILKAADLCVAEPERVARQLIDGGFPTKYEYALQALSSLPFGKWREYDPEDSLRFYALRLHEVGMITSTPNQLIAGGSDWRFLNELKRELKA